MPQGGLLLTSQQGFHVPWGGFTLARSLLPFSLETLLDSAAARSIFNANFHLIEWTAATVTPSPS